MITSAAEHLGCACVCGVLQICGRPMVTAALGAGALSAGSQLSEPIVHSSNVSLCGLLRAHDGAVMGMQGRSA
jgi:hypothetical protein